MIIVDFDFHYLQWYILENSFHRQFISCEMLRTCFIKRELLYKFLGKRLSIRDLIDICRDIIQ